MNPLLTASNPKLIKRSPEGKGGFPQLKKGQKVTSEHLRFLGDGLDAIRRTWGKRAVNANPVVSAYYSKIVPKSSRMKRLLHEKGADSDGSIVGVKYWGSEESPKHQIVHCLTIDALAQSSRDLWTAADLVDRYSGGVADSAFVSGVNREKDRSAWDERLQPFGLPRTAFCQTIVDACFVERFGVDSEAPDYDSEVIVTLYETDVSTPALFEEIGIMYTGLEVVDRSTVILSSAQYAKLKATAPYLIAMSLVERSSGDYKETASRTPRVGRTISAPGIEPTIGVIDTLFDKDRQRTYFADWVESYDLVDDNIERTEHSFVHGTCVDSIIVDGPSLNPLHDDGCGRFRVRHFGIAADGRFSILTLIRELEPIVKGNRDIKVWNLSLGSPLPISRNSISPVGALLDRLQKECDVVFVIAGTNLPERKRGEGRYPLGSPADSINALVVNAVNAQGEPASYSRVGPVLGSFTKPDVAYFGGDSDEPCLTWANASEHYSCGTSYAAPWISRKMAYLIEVVGLSKEAAKALLIDSASRWEGQGDADLVGYGVVPTHMDDILQCPDNEIRLVVTGVAGPNKTSFFDVPVPKSKGKQPYYGKATLCYFPTCSRRQGVDYTNTEIELKFGRIKDGEIASINDDRQGESYAYVKEIEARRFFQKWENSKVIRETEKGRIVPKKVYTNPNWGFSLVAKKRLDAAPREELPFGVVVSLKAMDGVNRFDTFVQYCRANRLFVEPVDIAQSVEIYHKKEEEIEFDDE